MKNTITFLLLILITSSAFAQPRLQQKKEQIKSLKIAYITEELNLTSEESAKFWPLYNAYEDKRSEFRHEKIRGYMDRLNANDIDKMSDKDATALLNQMETTEDEAYQSRKKFISSLKGVIPPIKIIKLKKNQFRMKLTPI